MTKLYTLFLVLTTISCVAGDTYAQSPLPTYEEYIREHLPSKQVIDAFLNDKTTWAKYDAELGYVLNNFMPHDGVNNSSTISTSQTNGARRSFMYINQPCRINTYGDSFTQGHQVSDGETWQEYLAAHLGEPIRNFGMGGYGVYQAYLRMLREEQSDHGAEYVILYIWGDDHMRSLLRSRYLLFADWAKEQDRKEGVAKMFHGNFWANVEIDLKRGVFIENKCLTPKPEDMYLMCDTDWMIDKIKDDLAVEMALYVQGAICSVNVNRLKTLSKILDYSIDLDDPKTLKKNVSRLLNKYSYSATKYILKKTNDYVVSTGKKLLVILFDPYGATVSLFNNQPRDDQEIVDYLQTNRFNYFDMNIVQVADYKNFNISMQKYWERYFIGHYNPAGNHFFAYSLAPTIIQWLNPKPITYQKNYQKINGFKGYLDMDSLE